MGAYSLAVLNCDGDAMVSLQLNQAHSCKPAFLNAPHSLNLHHSEAFMYHCDTQTTTLSAERLPLVMQALGIQASLPVVFVHMALSVHLCKAQRCTAQPVVQRPLCMFDKLIFCDILLTVDAPAERFCS